MRASFAAACSLASSSKCLSRIGSSGRDSGTAIMAVDYTGSGHEARRQYLVRAVTPQVDAVEQPVQFVDRQFDGFVTRIGFGLEALGFQSLEPQAEAIALPVENLDLAAGAIEEHEQHRVEHLHLDVQLDQRRQAIDGFAEVDRLGIQINLLDLGVGTHHGMNSRENRSSASADLRAIGRWGLWSAYSPLPWMPACNGCRRTGSTSTSCIGPSETPTSSASWATAIGMRNSPLSRKPWRRSTNRSRPARFATSAFPTKHPGAP